MWLIWCLVAFFACCAWVWICLLRDVLMLRGLWVLLVCSFTCLYLVWVVWTGSCLFCVELIVGDCYFGIVGSDDWFGFYCCVCWCFFVCLLAFDFELLIVPFLYFLLMGLLLGCDFGVFAYCVRCSPWLLVLFCWVLCLFDYFDFVLVAWPICGLSCLLLAWLFVSDVFILVVVFVGFGCCVLFEFCIVGFWV